MASLVGVFPERTARPRREGPGPLAQALRTGWDEWIAANLLAVAGGVFVLLGAAFFVAVAISHGWLTPPRQVAAAVAGGLALLVAGLRVWDGRDASRARVVLAQALAGAGAGTMLLGIVAGARIYDPPLYGEAVGLIGAGIVAALLVALSLRWNAQITAALGLATALGAPLLIGASPTTASVAFLAVALAASSFVIALRGWPWLLQLAIWLPAPQMLLWALRGEGISNHPAWLVVLALAGWWVLVAIPALLFEGGYRGGRIRAATGSALFLLASFVALAGAAAFDSFHARPFQALLAIVAALHLAAGLVLLRRARHPEGGVLVLSLGAALIAAAAASALGAASQPVVWAVEWVCLLWLGLRYRDVQAYVTAALLAALTLGGAILVAPPTALYHPAPSAVGAAVALGAAAFGLAGSAWLLRGDRRLALPAGIAAYVTLVYGVAVVTVAALAPAWNGTVDQRAQIAATLAWFLLGTLVLAASLVVRGDRLRAAAHGAASATVLTASLKLLLLDALALGPTQKRVALAGIAVAVLGAVLVELDRRARPRIPASLSVGVLLPLLAAAVATPYSFVGGLETPWPVLGLVGAGLAASLLGVLRLQGIRRAGALAVLTVLSVELATLALATGLTPDRNVVDELAQRSVTGSWLLLGLALAWLPALRRLPAELRQTAVALAGGLLVAAAVKFGVVDAIAFGAGPLAVLAAAVAVAGCAATLLAARRVAADLALAAIPLAAAAVAVLVEVAPPDALAYGATHGLRALAAAAVAAAAALVVAWLVDPRARKAAAAGVFGTVLYGISVLVVTALTPHPQVADELAQHAPDRGLDRARAGAPGRRSLPLQPLAGRAPHLARRRPARGRGRQGRPRRRRRLRGRPPGRGRRRVRCPGRGRGAARRPPHAVARRPRRRPGRAVARRPPAARPAAGPGPRRRRAAAAGRGCRRRRRRLADGLPAGRAAPAPRRGRRRPAHLPVRRLGAARRRRSPRTPGTPPTPTSSPRSPCPSCGRSGGSRCSPRACAGPVRSMPSTVARASSSPGSPRARCC